MTTAAAIEGLKISDISLLDQRTSGNDFKFHVEIELKGRKETRKKTGKESLEGNRVIWTEPISFSSNVIDSVITFRVFETRWPHISYSIGSCQNKVVDLLEIQNNNGSCELEIGSKSGRLVFNIEPQSESAILLNAVSGAEDASFHIPTMEHSTKVANITTSVHDTFVNQQETWSSFLFQFNVFMTAVDQIAEIHPYAKMAWSVLSAIPKAIIAEKNRNDSVKQLIEKLKETYDFITDAKRLSELRTIQTDALLKLVQQTTECGYFIQEYCRTSIVKKSLKGKSLDDQINAFVDVFDHLKRVMTDSIAVETNIVMLRVAVTITQIHELELLKEMPYDSKAGFSSEKRCLAGTRENLIQEIIDWVNQETSERMLVLSGAAGTGKSAVAHTIADKFKRQNRLGSLFCFSRSYPERRHLLFSTISRGIADGDDSWRKSLIKNIQNISIRTSSDSLTQFEELFVKPSRETSVIGPVVIVIDALDESGDPRERQPLLDILFGQVSKLPTNYRFILTTRPEQDIELRCRGPTVRCNRMGDIPKEETFSDIQSYVSSCLKPIAGLLDEIQRDWREILAKRAEGLFQWAETACRTMNSLYHRPSLRRAWGACTSGASTSLYELYHNVISSQRECEYPEFMDDFRLIVGTIIMARGPLTTDALENIFEGIVQDVKTTLRPFGSLLVGVHDDFTPIRPLHTSLVDFFHARNRDGTNKNEYYVDTSDQSIFTLGCLKLMNRMLRFNICNLQTAHLQNQDVPNFAECVEKAIPLHLSYACRFWGFHLRYSQYKKELLVSQLRILMQDKLLYWFEALGLLREIEKGRIAMRIMQNWCKDTDNKLAEQAADSWQFGYDFGDVIETSTPHLYISALPFTPKDSFISKQFLPMYPLLFSIEDGQQIDSTPRPGLMKKYSSSNASSLAFSPQGKYIATGFVNGEFWFWDYEFGEIIYQWEGREDDTREGIGNIVFSPDGQLVYCCFWNGHIRTWDVKTKETMDDSHRDILEGRCHWCTVSSDGRYIAFVVSRQTHDRTLLLCDRTSREKLMQVYAAKFSHPVFTPKGDMLAFLGRFDGLHLWDIRRRARVNSWKGYPLLELALSDRHIAFRSNDGIHIEVWDIHTLTKVGNVETNVVFVSIHFTSDQHLLVFSRKTYTILDFLTGNAIVENSLGDNIRLLAASPDSSYVALSTKSNCTIHVGPLNTPIRWKTSDILDEHDLNGLWMRGRYLVHIYNSEYYRTGVVLVSDTITNSIIFSREQILCRSGFPVAVVSPRNDRVYVAFATTCGLCVWDDLEGEYVLDKSIDITTLEYSALGDLLISAEGSCGCVKIWDVGTRTLVGGPYTVPGDIHALDFLASGERFMVAYEQGVRFVEVRERQSGHLLHGPFKLVDRGFGRDMIKLSANETKIICIRLSDIEVLDVITGERVFSTRHTRNKYRPGLHQLSPNRKYVAWSVEARNKVELWDIDNQVLCYQLLSSGRLTNLFFSDDSTQITTLYSMDDKHYIDIWNISTGEAVRKGIQLYSMDHQLLSLNGNHLMISDRCTPKGFNLDVRLIMSSLYEQHKNHSRFGMFPVDNLEARREIQTITRLTSGDEDVLEYALMAWYKALFSMATEISEDGWILGPHDELLLWIPERRRSSLWRPCMTHIGAGHFTKLNFGRFVHGSRWMECKRNP